MSASNGATPVREPALACGDEHGAEALRPASTAHLLGTAAAFAGGLPGSSGRWVVVAYRAGKQPVVSCYAVGRPFARQRQPQLQQPQRFEQFHRRRFGSAVSRIRQHIRWGSAARRTRKPQPFWRIRPACSASWARHKAAAAPQPVPPGHRAHDDLYLGLRDRTSEHRDTSAHRAAICSALPAAHHAGLACRSSDLRSRRGVVKHGLPGCATCSSGRPTARPRHCLRADLERTTLDWRLRCARAGRSTRQLLV
jgi:hypothetical protein